MSLDLSFAIVEVVLTKSRLLFAIDRILVGEAGM